MKSLFNTYNWSLRHRLIVLISGLSFAFMFLTILLIDIQTLAKEEETLSQKNNLVHQFLLANYSEILLTGNPDSGLDLVEKISTQTDLQALILKDLDGNIRFRYGELPETNNVMGFSGLLQNIINGDYILTADIHIVSKQIGEAVYYYQGQPLLQRLLINLQTDLFLLPFLLLITFVLARKSAESFTKPLVTLADQMHSPSAKSGLVSLPTDNQNRDIKKLYQGFNTLQKRILDAMNALQTEIEQKTYMANHDGLTGLLNRTGFDEQLEKTLRQMQTKASIFAFLDLDQFKLINDTAGHPVGDIYLQKLAIWFEEWLPENSFIGRLGGDEFGIWLADIEQAPAQLHALIELINARHFAWEGQVFHVGASIGMVEIHHADTQLFYLYQCADNACYAAKALGRNRIQRFEADNQEVMSQQNDILVLNQIRAALGDGKEHLELWAQTIVPLQDELQDGLLNYEVLVRMKDAQGNLINPGMFLPVAERYGEILHIDAWVLWNYFEQVCAYPEHLQRIGFVDINVTGFALIHKDFYATLQRALKTFDFPWHKLKIEITETTAVANFEQADAFVSLCKSHGIQIALDDFGSGMASFDYLKRLPFDTIKIDGVFIKNIIEDSWDESMVKFMIDISHLKSQTMVAEFVENQAIAEHLKSIGMHYAQGYYFGKPKPLSEWMHD